MHGVTTAVSVSPAPGPQEFDDIPAVARLPQTTMNNYFSIGSDALTALRVSFNALWI